jgi:putative DNA primase/helicase
MTVQPYSKWSDQEYDSPEGNVNGGEVRLLPSPTEPMAVARELVQAQYTDTRTGSLTLRHWRGGFWEWRTTHWEEREGRSVLRDAYAFTEMAMHLGRDGAPERWSPTRHKIANLLEALQAVTHLEETVSQPSWTDETITYGPIVACGNGLLELPTRRLLPHDPRYFNQTAVPFDYEPRTASVDRWLAFLDELWPEDEASIAVLQEFFGYVISGRLDLHKILLLVGPTRAGKGVIARMLGALIGRRNVAGPTLSSLSFDFGLAPLIGKPLAVISDARLDSKRDTSVVVERLLAISGEDTITVNRKYREQWTGKLPTRFLVISNELPRLGDASAAIANRFVVLLLQRSWLGHEDHQLERRLETELSGILNWALMGLDRLTALDRFTRPESTDEAIVALQDIASPVAAFVRDRCERGAGFEERIDILYAAWKAWAEDNGQRRTTAQTFGRDLRAVVPGLRVVRPRDDASETRERRYQGIRLESDQHSASIADHRGPERPGASESDLGPHRSTSQPNVVPAPEDVPV